MAEATQVGLKNLYYALLLTDSSGVQTTYGTPAIIAPVINAKIKPKSSSTVLYADDGADETATAVGETSLELETKNIPIAIQAILLGHTSSGGVMTRKTTDTAPYVAIGFESVKSNGTKRYVWLFKGKFEVPEDDFQTKEDKVNFQTAKIMGTFVKRAYDDAYQKIADEEDANYVSSVGTNWYTAVEGTADTTAPTVTTVPLDAATGVAVTSTMVWTFNEAIQASTMTAANFFVMQADGTAVAGALSINAGHTVVTFTPTANLAGTTGFIAVATQNVTDLAGNALAATSVTNFTTV